MSETYCVYRLTDEGTELVDEESYQLLVKGDKYSSIGLAAYASAIQTVLEAVREKLTRDEVREYRKIADEIFDKLYTWEKERSGR
jgi:hypothetical protein